MLLSDLNVGDKALVKGLHAQNAVRRRILDMGLIAGTRFKVLRVAPLGDPLELVFKGIHVTLRKSEAAGIEVEKAGENGDAVPMGQERRKRSSGR